MRLVCIFLFILLGLTAASLARPPSDQLVPQLEAPQISEPVANTKNDRLEDDTSSQEASEFWVILGRRLKVTDTLLVIFTFFLFLATAALWYSTRRLVMGAEKTAVQQLQAYVGIQRTRILEDVNSANGPLFRIKGKNFGQTPADNVTITVAIALAHFPPPSGFFDSVDLPNIRHLHRTKVSLFPGASLKATHGLGRTVTPQEVVALNAGTAAIYLIGEFRYLDIFGCHHMTQFKFFYGGIRPLADRQLTAWHEGNIRT